jgi:gas vesicle protein
MADESNDLNIVWFVAGAALGAVVALLYAPASGAETRRRLAERTEQGRAALAESGKDMLERGREMYDRGRRLADEAADMLDRGRQLVDDATAGVKPEHQG